MKAKLPWACSPWLRQRSYGCRGSGSSGHRAWAVLRTLGMGMGMGMGMSGSVRLKYKRAF
jgi:hypothetical protein